MNGDRPTVNGAHTVNGVLEGVTGGSSSAGPAKQPSLPHNATPQDPAPLSSRAADDTNSDVTSSQKAVGDTAHHAASDHNQPPTEILHLISQDSYLPLASLIGRASQSCWNGLSDLVEQLASLAVSEPPPDQVKLLPNGLPNNQLKANLDKKERLLEFANEHKAEFIKLLVLLQWSKNVDEVSKTISINYWLMLRRQAYWSANGAMALLKQESPGFQIPNPDLKTATEVLSRGKVGNLPRLGYAIQKDHSNKQIRRLLKTLNHALSVKLALSDSLPSQLQSFRVRDGRATIIVPDEFELDVSTTDERLESPLRLVDFRFSFQPSPRLPDLLHSEIERLANSNIDQGGLQKCYEFLHELTLSYKLAELHKQAIELSRNQWAGNLRIELLHRNLIVQYWSERQIGKSWLEIGIVSGRRRDRSANGESTSYLEVKCTWQGKRTETLQLSLNESTLRFEEVLRQVIAQHTTHILDNIYDGLVLSPLFANAELSLDQSLSYDDPDECALKIQTAPSSQLQLKVDAVTGLVILSPVTERTERLQFEVNRVQAVSDEVVSKLLNFRCSVRESLVLAAIAGTKWEALRSFKFSQAEVKTLFGKPIVRMNMFRQKQWALHHSLAFTHSQDGDYWWLLQQIPSAPANAQARYKVLCNQRVEVADDLSTAYFARLADYSMGLICLQRNADFFRSKDEKFDLRPFPAFDKHYELPEVSFNLDLARPAFSRAPPPTGTLDDSLPPQKARDSPVEVSSPPISVKVRFGGTDRSGTKVITVARYQNHASSAVLRQLDKSVLDSAVKLSTGDRVVTVRVETPIADVAVPEIVGKVVDLEKVVATVEQIHRQPGLKLKTVSNSRISFIYHHEPQTDLGMDIIFASGSPAPRLDFSPAKANPHQILSEAYAKMFAANHKPFAATMSDLLTNLTMTLPLVDYLHKLQQKYGLNSASKQPSNSAESQQLVRVHVLARSETHFALQYFAPAKQETKEAKNYSPPDMLARFEIFNHVQSSKRPMWALRPALEEFQSYSRPSFANSELQAKVKQEIFSFRTEGKVEWSTLDSGAACMTDRPEALLQALHEVLSTWAKQARSPVNKAGSGQDSNKVKGPQGGANTNSASLPNGAGNRTPGTKGPAGRPQAPVVNGVNTKQQRPAPNTARPTGGNAKPNARNPQKEVITLD